jgi:hypothetical protein
LAKSFTFSRLKNCKHLVTFFTGNYYSPNSFVTNIHFFHIPTGTKDITVTIRTISHAG